MTVADKSYALVLAGGGTRGIYQIGVWKALKELGIRCDVIIGSSIGALNAALMAQGDWEAAHRLWSDISMASIVKLPKKETQVGSWLKSHSRFLGKLLTKGGFDTEPLRQMIEKNIDENRLRKSGVRLGLTTFNLSDFRQQELFLEDIPEGSLSDYLLAATAFPGLRSQRINGDRCLDGGMADNIPFQLIRDSGYKNIIVVDISGLGRNKTPNCIGVNLVYIKNSIDFGKLTTVFGVFDFRREFLENFEKLGYLDTMKVFGCCGGIDYFIENDDLSQKFAEKLKESDRIREFRQLIPKNLRYYYQPQIAVVDLLAQQASLKRIKLYRFEEICAEIDGFFRGNLQKQNQLYRFYENLK